MIKVGIVSDLHSEYWSIRELDRVGGAIRDRLSDADLILVCGDVGLETAGIVVLESLFPQNPVYFVAGNHEFYRTDYQQTLDALRAAATDNIHFLHNEVGELDIGEQKVRIVGATLWTDFDLYGTPDLSMFHARQNNGLNDFRLIQYDGRILQPQDTLTWHHEQRRWLLDMLDEHYDGITIMMTHHSPVSFALAPRFVNDALSPCFVSRIEPVLLRDDLPLVVWGHTHHCVDRTIEGTRFVSNQVGYLSGPSSETGEYGQIVELEAINGADP